MGMYGGGGDGGAAATESDRQKALDVGTAKIDDIFSQYTPDFYQERGKAYTDYVMPQVAGQYRDTQKNLSYALARQGILKSSAAVGKGQALQSELQKNTTTVGNQANDQMNQLRSQVTDARSGLVNQLVASGDPSLVTSNAESATAGLRAPTAFQPIGNMFSDWSNAYLANMNARAADASTPNVWNQMGNNYGSSAAYN